MSIRIALLVVLLSAVPLAASAGPDVPGMSQEDDATPTANVDAEPESTMLTWRSDRYWTGQTASAVTATPLLDAQRQQFSRVASTTIALKRTPIESRSDEVQSSGNRRLLYIVAGAALAAGVATGAVLLLSGDSASDGLPDPPGRPPSQ